MSDLANMQTRAADIDNLYRPQGGWGLREYAEGAMGDLGDLMKLVMAKEGLRQKDDISRGLEHEVNDLMWSVLMMYRELGQNPVDSFMNAMNDLEQKIKDSAQ